MKNTTSASTIISIIRSTFVILHIVKHCSKYRFTIRLLGDTNRMLYRLCSWIVFDTIRYRPESYKSQFETRYGLKLVSELGRVDPHIWNPNFFSLLYFWRADSSPSRCLLPLSLFSSLLSRSFLRFYLRLSEPRAAVVASWSCGGRVVVAQLSQGGGAVVA